MAFATSITAECRKLETKIAKQQREIERLKIHIFQLEARHQRESRYDK